MNEVVKFRERLKKIGYEIELAGNVPWIYLHSVNGNRVKSVDWVNAGYGHCIAWFPSKHNDDFRLNWHDMDLTFKLIRKYGKPIWKFNGGAGATLCHGCSVIISKGFTKDLRCEKCNTKSE
jgi:hypothetical protein